MSESDDSSTSHLTLHNLKLSSLHKQMHQLVSLDRSVEKKNIWFDNMSTTTIISPKLKKLTWNPLKEEKLIKILFDFYKTLIIQYKN